MQERPYRKGIPDIYRKGKIYGLKEFIAVIVFILLILFPIAITLLWSFTVRWRFPDILPGDLSLYGIKAFINSGDYRIIPYSVLLSCAVSIISILMSVPAAMALTMDFRGKKFFDILVFLPAFIPVTAAAMGVQVSFIKLGLAYNTFGVILMQLFPCLPYSVRILRGVYALIPEGYREISLNLGEGRIRTFLKITLPLLIPGITSAFFMVFIVSFSQYFITLLVGGGTVETLATRMFPYIVSGNRTVASIYATIFTAVSLIFLSITEYLTGRFYSGKIEEFTYL